MAIEKYSYSKTHETLLPPLPKWNTDIYPFALMILAEDGHTYNLHCSSKPFFCRVENGSNIICFPQDGQGYGYATVAAWTSWKDYGENNPEIPEDDSTTEDSGTTEDDGTTGDEGTADDGDGGHWEQVFVPDDGWYWPDNGWGFRPGKYVEVWVEDTEDEGSGDETVQPEPEPVYYFDIGGTFIWTNENISTEGGVLVYSATEPEYVEPEAFPREEPGEYVQDVPEPDPISDRFVLSLPSFIEGLEYYRGTKALTWKTE